MHARTCLQLHNLDFFFRQRVAPAGWAILSFRPRANPNPSPTHIPSNVFVHVRPSCSYILSVGLGRVFFCLPSTARACLDLYRVSFFFVCVLLLCRCAVVGNAVAVFYHCSSGRKNTRKKEIKGWRCDRLDFVLSCFLPKNTGANMGWDGREWNGIGIA